VPCFTEYFVFQKLIEETNKIQVKFVSAYLKTAKFLLKSLPSFVKDCSEKIVNKVGWYATIRFYKMPHLVFE